MNDAEIEEYMEIRKEAVKRFNKFQCSYACQDVTVMEDFEYWIVQVTKERYGIK